MKKLILPILTLFIYCQSNGQSVHYKIEDLKQKTKMELTQIYLDEVKTLMNSLPYSPFALKPETVVSTDTISVENVEMKDTLGQKSLDIPKTKYTQNKLDDMSDKTTDFNEVLQTSLFEIIPYSDKVDIINAILYVQKINERMSTLIK